MSVRRASQPCRTQGGAVSFSSYFSLIIMRKTLKRGGKETRPLSRQPNEPAACTRRADGPRGARPSIDKILRAKQAMEDEHATRRTGRVHLPGKMIRWKIFEEVCIAT